MSRIQSRDVLFKLVFELCFHSADAGNYYDHLEEENLEGIDNAWVEEMYTGIIEHQDELKDIVGKYIKGYTVERLFKVDLAILMLATYELKYCSDTEVKVIANEAVELAKKYSTDKSFKFINGVIATLSKELR